MIGSVIAGTRVEKALPLVAVETAFSFGRGMVMPEAWQGVVAAWAEGGPGVVAVLADVEDLTALPEALRSWGPERVGVGACLMVPARDRDRVRASDGHHETGRASEIEMGRATTDGNSERRHDKCGLGGPEQSDSLARRHRLGGPEQSDSRGRPWGLDGPSEHDQQRQQFAKSEPGKSDSRRQLREQGPGECGQQGQRHTQTEHGWHEQRLGQVERSQQSRRPGLVEHAGRSDHRAQPTEQRLLLIAPDQAAYAALCELLSWRQEQPAAWQRFCDGGAGPPSSIWRRLVVLGRDAAWLTRLLDLGAEVHWQSELRPGRVPPTLAARGVDCVCLPRLVGLEADDLRQLPLMAALQRGGTVAEQVIEPAACVADLAGLSRRFAGFEEQLLASDRLRRRCQAFADHDPDNPCWQVPPCPVADHDADDELRCLAEAGLPQRYPLPLETAVHVRLQHELVVIRQTRFAGYILTVHDLVAGRITCGRGSGAGSLVCYLLGITNVDPIRYQLLFERFLTPSRRDPPDIDVDLPWDERDDALDAALSRYGRDRAALVATHLHLERWSALREAARAHGLDDGAITAMRQRLDQQRRFGGQLDAPPPWPTVFAAARRLRGLPRHRGVHCGGVVITATPIRQLVPLHPAAKQVGGRAAPTIAWEKDGAEQMGLVKIDLLGNRSLAVIRDCLADLAAAGASPPRNSWLHPDGDAATRALIASGATMGCFYIESPATRQLQQKAASPEFDRLVVHSSIIRPAAMRYIDRYLERLHDFKEHGVDRPEWYPHPVLANLLSESFGVLSYQEDVMLVCQKLAGFDEADANRIRKTLGAWGDSQRQRMQELADKFFSGCRVRGIDEAVIEEVWQMIESFTGYSFCKAHSASYAMVSYQCAYLKAHYPAIFLGRVIANGGGFYHPGAYVEEARRLGITILPPCVVTGEASCRGDLDGRLRLGLQQIHDCSPETARRIDAARQDAPFASLADLRHRAGLDRDALQGLLDAGALDRLLAGRTPAQRAWLVGAVCRQTPTGRRDGQTSLLLDERCHSDPAPPPLPAIGQERRDHRQFAALGGICSRAHPLCCLWELPPRRHRCRDIVATDAGHRRSLIGWRLTSKQVRAHYQHDRQGQKLAQPDEAPMAFVTIEDETGLLETVWFPETYQRYGRLLAEQRPLRLTGRIDAPYGCVTMQVDRVESVFA